MSKVQQIRSDYYRRQDAPKSKSSNTPNFGGLNEAEYRVFNAATDKLNKKFTPNGKEGIIAKTKGGLKWAIKKPSDFLGANSGETQTQVLNAIFTCTLAPLMIWKNPFMKKDEDQKAYAALRQPISAGIALTVTLAMTKLMDDYLETTLNEGNINSLDSRVAPTKGYLNKMFNDKHGKALSEIDLTDKEAVNKFLKDNELASINPKLFEDPANNMLTRALKKRNIKNAIMDSFGEVVSKDRKTLFTALIGENPDNIDFNNETKEIFVKRNGKLELIGSNIPNFEKKEHVTAFMEKHNIHKMTLAELLEKEYGLKIHKDGALAGELKGSSLKQLREIKASDFLRVIGLSGSSTSIKTDDLHAPIKEIDEVALGEVLNRLNDTKTAKVIRETIQESALKAENAPERLGQGIGKSASRTATMLDGGVNEESIQLNSLLERMRDKRTPKSESLKELFKDKVDVATKKIAELLGIVDKKGGKQVAEPIDVAANLVDRQIKNLNKIKNYKGFVLIGFNLFSTAVSCYVLNWAYPRIVEKFWPHLVKDKESEAAAQKGGNK